MCRSAESKGAVIAAINDPSWTPQENGPSGVGIRQRRAVPSVTFAAG